MATSGSPSRPEARRPRLFICIPTKWQFTSYERDGESGNDYAIFRFHLSRLGRFSSPDPFSGSTGSPQSLNRYAYVLNDPIRLVDPLGLQLWGWSPQYGWVIQVTVTEIRVATITISNPGAAGGGSDIPTAVNARGFGGLPVISETEWRYQRQGVGPGGGLFDADWWRTFWSEFLKSNRQQGESFGECVTKSIHQTTFGLIPRDPLKSAAIVGSAAIGGTVTTVQRLPSPLNPSVRIPISSMIGGLVGFGARAFSGGVISKAAAGAIAVGTTKSIAIVGGAGVGLLIGSAINCR